MHGLAYRRTFSLRTVLANVPAPEIRFDPITGQCVIVAPNRALRPHEFLSGGGAASATCPFCEGNESQTPGEIFACRNAGSPPDAPGWRVRVVPNKFPALEIPASNPVSRAIAKRGMRQSMTAAGVHEVIVESPRHVSSTSDLTIDELTEVLLAYGRRLDDLSRDPRIAYALIFKNVGLAGGASLSHTHSQLIGLPIVPESVIRQLTGASLHHEQTGRCAFCDTILEELERDERLVIDRDGFVAFCPFASRFPYEVRIAPKIHASHFEPMDPPTAKALASVLNETVARLETVLDRPAYNYVLHTAPFQQPQGAGRPWRPAPPNSPLRTPFDSPEIPYYHWHIEILPRVTQWAGFEWGTGVTINAVCPEVAAAALRGAQVESPPGRNLPIE